MIAVPLRLPRYLATKLRYNAHIKTTHSLTPARAYSTMAQTTAPQRRLSESSALYALIFAEALFRETNTALDNCAILSVTLLTGSLLMAR